MMASVRSMEVKFLLEMKKW